MAAFPDWRIRGFGRNFRKWTSQRTLVLSDVQAAVQYWARDVIRNGPPTHLEIGPDTYLAAVSDAQVHIVYTVADYEELVVVMEIY